MNPDYLSPIIPKNVEKPPDSLLNLLQKMNPKLVAVISCNGLPKYCYGS